MNQSIMLSLTPGAYQSAQLVGQGPRRSGGQPLLVVHAVALVLAADDEVVEPAEVAQARRRPVRRDGLI